MPEKTKYCFWLGRGDLQEARVRGVLVEDLLAAVVRAQLGLGGGAGGVGLLDEEVLGGCR